MTPLRTVQIPDVLLTTEPQYKEMHYAPTSKRQEWSLNQALTKKKKKLNPSQPVVTLLRNLCSFPAIKIERDIAADTISFCLLSMFYSSKHS